MPESPFFLSLPTSYFGNSIDTHNFFPLLFWKFNRHTIPFFLSPISATLHDYLSLLFRQPNCHNYYFFFTIFFSYLFLSLLSYFQHLCPFNFFFSLSPISATQFPQLLFFFLPTSYFGNSVDTIIIFSLSYFSNSIHNYFPLYSFLFYF